jgi:hypothetical protein
MQIQTKLYEEWVDIMKDYSTVFCSDGNEEILEEKDSEGKSALERSADVRTTRLILFSFCNLWFLYLGLSGKSSYVAFLCQIISFRGHEYHH